MEKGSERPGSKYIYFFTITSCSSISHSSIDLNATDIYSITYWRRRIVNPTAVLQSSHIRDLPEESGVSRKETNMSSELQI